MPPVQLRDKYNSHYCATLCCRPVTLCPSVRLSDCLSVTLVDCIQTAEDIIKLISRPDSSVILVFQTRAPVPNSKGNPFCGDAKYSTVGIFCDFRLKSPSISETVRDRPMVAIRNVNRKSYATRSIE